MNYTCIRKKRYYSYEQAKEILTRMRENVWDDPTLHVYECPDGGHWHLGHATGEQAITLTKRANRLRQKAGDDGQPSIS